MVIGIAAAIFTVIKEHAKIRIATHQQMRLDARTDPCWARTAVNR